MQICLKICGFYIFLLFFKALLSDNGRLGRNRSEESAAVTAGPGQLACYTACLQLLATLAQVAALRPHLAENIKVRLFVL
jgi:hypothetical protein